MGEAVQVSIICNVYNHGPYVRDALEGFVTQKTSFPFEVLVHDDASTDNSAEIIREYEQKYPEIIKAVYQTDNQHSQGVRINDAFQRPRVRGKYIATCEGDDYWTDPLKLQKQYDFMEGHPEYTLCACSTVWLDMRTGKSIEKCLAAEDRDVSAEELIKETNGRIFQYATIFMRADLWINLPDWFRFFPVGDYPMLIFAADNGKVRMLADTMAVYRNNVPNSWTARFSEDDQQKVRMITRMIEGLNAFNDATAHRYDKLVSWRIKRHRYNLARINHDLKLLKSDELKEIYASRTFLSRTADIMSCKFPGLYRQLKKIATRFTR